MTHSKTMIKLTAPLLILSLMALPGCLYTESTYMEKVQEAEENKKLADENAEKLAKLEKDLEASKKEFDEFRHVSTATVGEFKKNKELDAAIIDNYKKQAEELQVAKKELNATKEVLDREKQIHDQLAQDLKEEIADGRVKVLNSTVGLEDRVVFDSGVAHIKASGFRILKKIGQVLKKFEDKHIQVQGHTDNQPIKGASRSKYPTNWELSTARATNIVRYLETEVQFEPKHISAAGFGSNHPIASNDTIQGRQQNRRVEFVLLPIGERASKKEAAPEVGKDSTPVKDEAKTDEAMKDPKHMEMMKDPKHMEMMKDPMQNKQEVKHDTHGVKP